MLDKQSREEEIILKYVTKAEHEMSQIFQKNKKKIIFLFRNIDILYKH